MTFEELKAGIEALFHDVSTDWTPAERVEVQRWIDMVEYPMALDNLSGVLQEERYPITSEQRDRLKALAIAAKCDPRVLDVDWLVDRPRRQ